MSKEEVKDDSIKKQILSWSVSKLMLFWKTSSPVLLWGYLICIFYITVGICLFPSWWRRAIFGGNAALTKDFWHVTFISSFTSIKLGHPLAVSFCLIILLSLVIFIYSVGKHGLGKVFTGLTAPRTAYLVIISIFLIMSVFSLRNIKNEYMTPNEMIKALEASKDLSPMTFMHNTSPPETGIYVYLNAVKIAEAYNALQNDLVLSESSEKTTEQIGEGSSITLGPASKQQSSGHSEELSVTKAAAPQSPARMASWLIKYYLTKDLAADLSEYEGPESYEVRNAKETLKKRGVELNSSQDKQLRQGDAELFARKLVRAQSNSPIIISGLVKVTRLSNDFVMTFTTRSIVPVTCRGILEAKLMPLDLVQSAGSGEGCKFSARILGIIWKANTSSDEIKLDIIPLAIW